MNMTPYGLFKNCRTPDDGEPDDVEYACTWSAAVRKFAEKHIGGAVYNLRTGKHIAQVSA
ncbi:MAG: hypothetical protein NC548_60315 [Lachnospiraceae bacterium]|nr:hypothetical protein [Lachnospiraceae bacterium]